MKLRGGFKQGDEPFFVFRDKSPLKAQQATAVLKKAISNLGPDDQYYSMHSFCISRTSDLIKFEIPIETIRRLGR